MIHHTYINSTTGQLYCTSLEYLLLEIGISTNLTLVDFDKFHVLATNSLVKSSWSFLHQNHDITLQHNIEIPKNTLHDQSIMAEICKIQLSHSELEHINQCRLYLQAYYISDIATASGQWLSYHAWEGEPRPFRHTSRCIWPTQGKPNKAAWTTWRQTLKKTILARGMRLKQELGPWLRTDMDIWQWYFCPSLDGLIHLSHSKIILHQRKIPTVTTNTFWATGTIILNLPARLLHHYCRTWKRENMAD